MHDVSNNVIPPNVSNLFTYSSKVHHHNTRFSASGNFYIKCSRTDHMKNSFSRISAKLWNSIPVSCLELMLAMIWSGPITDPSCRLYIIKKGNKRHGSLRLSEFSSSDDPPVETLGENAWNPRNTWNPRTAWNPRNAWNSCNTWNPHCSGCFYHLSYVSSRGSLFLFLFWLILARLHPKVKP